MLGRVDALLSASANIDDFELTLPQARHIIGEALTALNPDDNTFLFVPGQVVYMHDNSDGQQQQVLTDGSLPSLRIIHFVETILADHLAEPYRASLPKAAAAAQK